MTDPATVANRIVPGERRTLSTPDAQKLDDIYAQLERHHLGEQVLHPGHVEALWEATRRLEQRMDTLAAVWAWLQSAPWLQPGAAGQREEAQEA